MKLTLSLLLSLVFAFAFNFPTFTNDFDQREKSVFWFIFMPSVYFSLPTLQQWREKNKLRSRKEIF